MYRGWINSRITDCRTPSFDSYCILGSCYNSFSQCLRIYSKFMNRYLLHMNKQVKTYQEIGTLRRSQSGNNNTLGTQSRRTKEPANNRSWQYRPGKAPPPLGLWLRISLHLFCRRQPRPSDITPLGKPAYSDVDCSGWKVACFFFVFPVWFICVVFGHVDTLDLTRTLCHCSLNYSCSYGPTFKGANWPTYQGANWRALSESNRYVCFSHVWCFGLCVK